MSDTNGHSKAKRVKANQYVFRIAKAESRLQELTTMNAPASVIDNERALIKRLKDELVALEQGIPGPMRQGKIVVVVDLEYGPDTFDNPDTVMDLELDCQTHMEDVMPVIAGDFKLKVKGMEIFVPRS